MYYSIFLLLIFVYSDNIEVSTSDFDFLIIGKKVICSKRLKNCNSIKISYQGTSIYKLKEIKPKIFYLNDVTIYYKKPKNNKIRIDYEYKYFGLILDAWIMSFVISLILIYFMFICKKPFFVFEV